MSSTPVTMVQNIDDIIKPLNNVTLVARLIWVDPSPSSGAGTSSYAIRLTLSDHSRSIRLVLWGHDEKVKAFLTDNMMKIFSWEGLTARAPKEKYLSREHAFSLSLNADDKWGMKFVGRFHMLDGCQAPFLTVSVPMPLLMAPSPFVPSMFAPRSSSTPSLNSSVREPAADATTPQASKRGRDQEMWKCPNMGCRLPDHTYCMITGKKHPAICELCGTQGKYMYCPAAQRGTKVVHPDMLPDPVKEAVPVSFGSNFLTVPTLAEMDFHFDLMSPPTASTHTATLDAPTSNNSAPNVITQVKTSDQRKI